MHGHGEPQPDVHADRVELHLRVDELAEFGELDDVVEQPVGLRVRQADDRGVQVDVLPAGQLGMEPGAERQQRGDPARAC